MMKSLVVTIAFALFTVTPSFAQPVVLEGLASWEDVVEAVEEINAAGSGTIKLNSRVEYQVDSPLPEISADITLEGNGGVLKSVAGYVDVLASIGVDGRLSITDLFITGFSRNPDVIPGGLVGLIDNSGHLSLMRVTVAENRLDDDGRPYSFPLLVNRNDAVLNNATFFGNFTRSNGIALEYFPIHNLGRMEVMHSTIAENIAKTYWCTSIGGGLCSGEDYQVSVLNEGELEFGNSLLADAPEDCYLKNATSLGGSLITDPACTFDPEMDVLNQPASLGRFGYQGGLVPTVSLAPDSAAIDIGLDENCTTTDARLASRPASGPVDGLPKCDAGAFEYDGNFGDSDQTASAMTGSWYDIASNGEGFMIHAVNEDTAVAYYYGYDLEGDRLWLIGQSDGPFKMGEPLLFEAQHVVGGSFTDFNIDNVVRSDWGAFEFTQWDCWNATMEMFGDHGEKSLALTRVALTSGSTCFEDESKLETDAVTGSWFEIETSGQGFSVHKAAIDRGVIYFYGYNDEGENHWLIGVWEEDWQWGEEIVIPMQQATGGVFDEFDPEDILREDWGTLTIRFGDCDNGWAMLDGLSGTQELDLMLLAGSVGLKCPSSPQ